eukprot:gene278-biopygen9435
MDFKTNPNPRKCLSPTHRRLRVHAPRRPHRDDMGVVPELAVGRGAAYLAVLPFVEPQRAEVSLRERLAGDGVFRVAGDVPQDGRPLEARAVWGEDGVADLLRTRSCVRRIA